MAENPQEQIRFFFTAGVRFTAGSNGQGIVRKLFF